MIRDVEPVNRRRSLHAGKSREADRSHVAYVVVRFDQSTLGVVRRKFEIGVCAAAEVKTNRAHWLREENLKGHGRGLAELAALINEEHVPRRVRDKRGQIRLRRGLSRVRGVAERNAQNLVLI